MMKSDDFTYCARLARERDYARYLCALAAPSAKRHALFVLLAFNDELGKIRDIVSEPALGDIRLAWWRESLNASSEGDGGTHPVARALTTLKDRGDIDTSALEAMIDGRARDMDPGSFATLPELEKYAADTAGSLAAASLQLLDVEDEGSKRAAIEVATAWALIGILRSLPYHERAGRQILGRGIARLDILDRAEDLLIAARGRARQVQRKAQPVLLLGRLCDPWLPRFRACQGDPYKVNPEFAPLSPIWRVLSGRLTGRY
jgi:NADH dehydrogenase [ubiquinone] 1 alpha subcomplex assembly factor 6